MSSMADEFSEALADVRKEYAASVTYFRGTDEVDLTDVCDDARKVFRFQDSSGFQVIEVTTDFLIEASQLEGLKEPRQGDIIKRAVGDTIEIFKVEAPNGEECFRYQDANRTAMRIHTIKREVIAE